MDILSQQGVVAVEHCAFCNRGPVVVLCVTCGHTCQGRARKTCNQHPEVIHLMDYTCCSECKSIRLKECGYLGKTPKKETPSLKTTLPSLSLTVTVPASSSNPTTPVKRVVTYKSLVTKPKSPLTPLSALSQKSPYKQFETRAPQSPSGLSASPVPTSPQKSMYCGIGRGKVSTQRANYNYNKNTEPRQE